jgi:hypothetical protein
MGLDLGFGTLGWGGNCDYAAQTGSCGLTWQGNLVLANAGLLGFGGAAGGPNKLKGDHFDNSGCNRATQGQPLYGIQTKIQQPSSMASNINIR